MAIGRPKGSVRCDINVTPLIDIVLVLLLVFIVLLPGLSKALTVAVPKVVKTAHPVPADPHQPPIVVTLDAQGRLLLQNDTVPLSGLAGALVPAVQLQPAGLRRVFLRIDGEQPWQKGVDVLDQIRLASDRARRETASRPGWGGQDGGDIKVVVALKRPS